MISDGNVHKKRFKAPMREVVSTNSMHYWLRVERRRMKTYVSRMNDIAYGWWPVANVVDNSHGQMDANMSNWHPQETNGGIPMEDHMDFVQSSVVERHKLQNIPAGRCKRLKYSRGTS